MFCRVVCYQTCCCAHDDCCAKRHQLRQQVLAVNDVTNPAAMLVLGLQLCIAEAEVPAAAASEAGNQSIGWETDDEEYALVTFEHRRSIEADYLAVNCLAQQPQVFTSLLH